MKKFFIALILLTGVQGQANAQFFKKLGNAIDKAAKTVDNVANTILGDPNQSNNSNNKKRAIGKSYNIGDTKVTQFGTKDSGMKITDLSCYRTYGGTSVVLNFQLYNGTEYTYDIISGFSEISSDASCLFIDHNGDQYTEGWTDLGTKDFTLFNCQKNGKILDDSKLNCRLLVAKVPTKVDVFKRAEIPISYITKNQTFHDNCSFRLDNIPIGVNPAIKSNGIYGEGQVMLGDNIKDLPQAINRMYDDFTITDYPYQNKTLKLLTFNLKGEPMFKALSYDEQTIAMIFVDTPIIPFKVGDRFYRVNEHINTDDYSFFTKQDDGNYLFKDMLITQVDDPKSIYDMIGGIYIGEFPKK